MNHILVDLDDLDVVMAHSWHFSDGYVINTQGERLHRLVTQAPMGLHVHHTKNNRRDNRKKMLHVCAPLEHGQYIRAQREHPGVYPTKNGRFRVRLKCNHEVIYLGTFDDLATAIAIRHAAERRYRWPLCHV